MSEAKNINIQLIQPLIKEFPFSDSKVSAFSYISIEEYPIHSHLHMELIYVAEGSLSVKVGVSDYVIHAGEFTIINPFELHALYSTGQPNKTCILEINPDFYDPVKDGTVFVSAYFLYKDAARDDFDRITDVMQKIFDLHLSTLPETEHDIIGFPVSTDDNCTQYEKSLLRSLINYFELHFTSEYFLLSDARENSLRDNALQANRLKSILNYFYTHFPQKIRLQDVADATFTNRYHVSHLVKSGIGYTFSEMLQHIRIEKAEIYLLATDMPISQIVFDLGFSSYRYFSQHFKNMFDMTPTAYRKKYQKATIKYRDISYITPTTDSDIRNALELFSHADHPYSSGESGSSRAIPLAEVLNEHRTAYPAKRSGSFPHSLPENGILYDSPYFPALMLAHMGGDILEYARENPRFFTVSHSGIPCSSMRSSLSYLYEFLTPFLSAETSVIPGCFAAETFGRIYLLLYHAPSDAASVLTHPFSDSDELYAFVEGLGLSGKSFKVDLRDLSEDGNLIIRKRTLSTEFDAFSQLHRMSLKSPADENMILMLNDASRPDSYFERFDPSLSESLYETHLAPFHVQLIELNHFTELA